MEEDKAGGCHVKRTGRRSSDLRVGRNKALSKNYTAAYDF